MFAAEDIKLLVERFGKISVKDLAMMNPQELDFLHEDMKKILNNVGPKGKFLNSIALITLSSIFFITSIAPSKYNVLYVF